MKATRMQSCTPHNPERLFPQRRPEVPAEVVWWPTTFSLILCREARGPDVAHPTQICPQWFPHQWGLSTAWGLDAVFPGDPGMFGGGHIRVGVQRGELQPCTASFDHRGSTSFGSFPQKIFSPGQKVTWTLKSFKRIILNFECRRLPALGWQKSKNTIVFLQLKECKETKWNRWGGRPRWKAWPPWCPLDRCPIFPTGSAICCW